MEFLENNEMQEKVLKLELRLAQIERVEAAQKNFISFVKHVWPEFIPGEHHRIIAEKLERVAKGELKRLIVNMPPRHTKSEFASFLFPAWMIGQKPSMKIIQATHTTELAVSFGRKVKNLMEREDYNDIFPDAKLALDSKASGRWDTSRGGMYYAVGVGSNLAGRGADLCIIDDPHSEQDAMVSTAFDKAYDWYTGGPRQRLQPGGAIILVMCMTGDTPVLMADGTEKFLRDIRPGDKVSTFEKGRLSVTKVNNWQSSGVDSIYKIQTRSGKILRANERHPFLVMNEGVLEWTRLKHLEVGDLLVSLKDAIGLQDQKQKQVSVVPAKQKRLITGKTLTRLIGLLGGMGCGKESSALVESPYIARGSAPHATENNTLRQSQVLKKTGRDELSTVMESLWSSTKQWLKNAIIFAMYAGNHQRPVTPVPTGMASCALTTATTQEQSGGCFATTVTLQLGMEKHQAYLNELHRISDFTADPIVSITPDGEEEVFDVEIDRTENFIANGFVSHNTRWSEKDLTGQLMRAQARDPLADQWEVVEFPMELPSGEPVWPEYWSKADLISVKASIPASKWNAQYQQNPTGDENSILKREWWRVWEGKHVPQLQYVIQSYDTAFSKRETADFSAITTWGVFYPEEGGPPNLILLDSRKGRWDFPELKAVAHDMYKFWEPETVIIEAKASGMPLTHELRNMGIPVVNFTPSRGNDKLSRVHSVSPLFESGMVWAPDEPWAEELIEECAAFPNGEYDDLVDSTTQALMRYRQGNFVELPSDDVEDDTLTMGSLVYYG